MSAQPENMIEVIKQVEKFIRKIHDREHEIAIKAQSDYGRLYDYEHQAHIEVSTKLATSMTEYVAHKKDDEHRMEFARKRLFWITKEFLLDIVKDGEGLVQRSKDCFRKLRLLEEENEKLSENYVLLQGQYNEISNRYNEIMRKRGLTE